MKRPRLAIFLFFISVTSLQAQELKCSTRAKSAILYNPENGVILYQKDAHRPHPPASTIKIATSIFALDQKNINLEDRCLASEAALALINADIKQSNYGAYPTYILEHDGVMIGIKAGKSYSLDTLLHGMLLGSGNDAANVFAESCSGSIEKFMEELNGYLRDKGLTKTFLQNPHGLHHPAQVTTAYEMALIAAMGFNNPIFAKTIKAPSFNGELSIRNTNKLLKEGQYKYPKILGGKTGYVASAGYNLVAAAEDKGRRLIAVVFGCKTSEERFKDVIALFETAFREEKKERILFSKDHECFVRKVVKAEGTLKGHLDQDIVISYFPSEERNLKAHVVWNNIQLPIVKGSEVGKIIVEDDKGNSIVEGRLYSAEGLKKSLFFRISEYAKWVGLSVVILLVLFWGFKFLKKSSKIT